MTKIVTALAQLMITVDEDASVERVNYLVTRCQELKTDFELEGVPLRWGVRSPLRSHDRSPEYPDDRPEGRGK